MAQIIGQYLFMVALQESMMSFPNGIYQEFAMQSVVSNCLHLMEQDCTKYCQVIKDNQIFLKMTSHGAHCQWPIRRSWCSPLKYDDYPMQS